MIPAKRRELVKAFHRHISAFRLIEKTQRTASYQLLLFYGVECGLKALILKEILGNTTDDMLNHNYLGSRIRGDNGHNLKEFLHFLNAPATHLPDLLCKNTHKAPVKQYNQVWRYCIEIEDRECEEKVVAELLRIAKWIEEGI